MLRINPRTGEAEDIALLDLMDGGVKELADINLKRVLQNIADLNTSHKQARTISVKFKFVPNENRDVVAVSVDVACTLAPMLPIETTLDVGRDEGKLVAVERPKYTPGQISFSDETNVRRFRA